MRNQIFPEDDRIHFGNHLRKLAKESEAALVSYDVALGMFVAPVDEKEDHQSCDENDDDVEDARAQHHLVVSQYIGHALLNNLRRVADNERDLSKDDGGGALINGRHPYSQKQMLLEFKASLIIKLDPSQELKVFIVLSLNGSARATGSQNCRLNFKLQ